nr:conotoxin precursor B2 [Conus ebraeus]
MQGMTGMPRPQFLPFNHNFAVGFKRENLEKRRHNPQFCDNNQSPFGSVGDLDSFMNFMKENGNNLPFEDVNGAATDLGHFDPSDENEAGKFRFFDKEQ